jgi:hypothetical protein
MTGPVLPGALAVIAPYLAHYGYCSGGSRLAARRLLVRGCRCDQ